VLGEDPSAAIFEQLAEASNIEALRRTCPQTFAPFAEEVERARQSFSRGQEEG
jgi:hypothetical protein